MSEQPQPSLSDTITIDDFTRVKLRVGRVIEASVHPQADRLLVVTVDLGDERRQICTGLIGHYAPDQLIGRNIIVVANLAIRAIDLSVDIETAITTGAAH